MANRVVTALASLRLTVTLFALAMFLIFAGTLAQATQGTWPVIDGYFRSLIAWIDLGLFVPRQVLDAHVRFPFPGGGLIAGLLIINLIAAHLVRFKATRRRVGVVVLHAGLIVLLAGEFVTGWFADEGLMAIDEGGSANYVEDAREVELAVIDRSGADVDRVVAVPQSTLERPDASVRVNDLPFTVRIEQWMANSTVGRVTGRPTATDGIGLQVEANPRPRVSGVEMGQTDAPSAYVSLASGESRLGTWLVSVNLGAPQTVTVDGKPYDLFLRFKRTYKPYTLHLIDFRHDKFTGTEVARNFSSRVRLVDPTRGTDRTVLIYMNNPLRYAGETFYQASFKPDNSGTVLQVVRNPGWLLPYVACTLVTLGLLIHFVMTLAESVQRRGKAVRQAEAKLPAPRPAGGWAVAALPWAAAAVGLLIALSGLFGGRGPGGAYDIERFVRLPVSADGRVKPMDTVARNALMIAGSRQAVRTETGIVRPGTFLLDLMARPETAKDYPVVRVDHPDVLALLDRSPAQAGRLRLSDLEPHWAKVAEQAGRASQLPSRQRDPFQRAVLQLFERVNRLLDLSRMRSPYAIPPLAPGEDWQPFDEAFLAARQGGDGRDAASAHPAVAHVVAVMTAYHEQKPEDFNRAVDAYDDLVRRALPAEARKADLEVWFNRAAPFYGATIVYVLAFLAGCASLLLRLRAVERPGTAEGLRRVMVGLLWSALIVHTVAIGLRIYLQGRPPVTNLYSSAIFVGWACVLMALLFERLYPLGLAALGAAAIGTGTLVVAHNLGNDGDTLQMMQAVLDSNFWLATHVITVTLGYSATFLAGAMAALYLLLGLFTRFLTPDRSKALAKMVYGTVCFAILFSFVGTVLGGIWADQSWGRFWGWDPKENGAALVVLINALILHARWGGLLRTRGIMVAAVGGNIVTVWSWFGTNLLGVGLHAYGFMESGVFWMMAFVVSQILLMGLGLLPQRAWRSEAAA